MELQYVDDLFFRNDGHKRRAGKGHVRVTVENYSIGFPLHQAERGGTALKKAI